MAPRDDGDKMQDGNGAASDGGQSVPRLSPFAEDAGDVEDPLLPGSPRPHRHRALKMLPLVALIFYEVSGGPFGVEDAVSAGGPLLAVLGFAILPFVWSIPEALVTAELASTYPENSGYVAWVTEAFGPFFGFLEGLFSWISGVTDNAIYPVMFLTYIDAAWPEANLMEYKKLFLITLSAALAYMNWRGLTLVGGLAVAFTVIIIVPFVLLIIIGAPRVDPRNWLKVDWETVDWGEYINVMFWNPHCCLMLLLRLVIRNLNYWDSVSTLAGEVSEPGKTLPRALGGAVVLVISMYLFPLMVGLGITTDTDDWTLGYFSHVAEAVAGRWLVYLMVAAAAVSQLGQYQAEMSSDSYQLLGMSERGILPKALSHRSRHGTPTLALLLSCLGILVMISFEFMQIVEMLNVVYCLAELLEFAAFVRLRQKHPDLERPFRVPLPTWGLVVMLTPASALLVFVTVNPFVSGNLPVICFTLGSVLLGCLLYPLLQVARSRGWCEFHEVEAHPPTWADHLAANEDPDEVAPTDDRIGSWATDRVYSDEVVEFFGERHHSTSSQRRPSVEHQNSENRTLTS